MQAFRQTKGQTDEVQAVVDALAAAEACGNVLPMVIIPQLNIICG